MDEHVLIVVLPIDEAIAVLHVEPLHGALDGRGQHFFLDLGLGLFVGVVFLRVFLRGSCSGFLRHG
jgi:hypothetical protein